MSSEFNVSNGEHSLASAQPGRAIMVFISHRCPKISADLSATLQPVLERISNGEIQVWGGMTDGRLPATASDDQLRYEKLTEAIAAIESAMRKPTANGREPVCIYVLVPAVSSSGRGDTLREPQQRGGLAPGARRRVLDFIEREMSRGIVLSDLAAIEKLSEFHFARAFKQSVGVSPHHYVMQCRIAASARLIRDSDRSLADIALDVGFSDQSHFTRVFQRQMRETPSTFRRRHR